MTKWLGITALMLVVVIISALLFVGPGEAYMESDLSIIVPEATVNLISNPSFENGTTGWTASGGSIAQSTDEQLFGLNSLAVTPTSGANDGAYFGTVSLTSGQYYTISVWFKGTNRIPYRIYFADNTGVLVGRAMPFTGNGDWQYVELTYKATSTAAHRIYVAKNNHTNTDDFYIDAVQVENKQYATTYCDGDQPGCSWNAAPHAGTSSRTAQSRAGGREINLEAYGLMFRAYGALGMPPQSHNKQDWAQLPGAALTDIRTETRNISLDVWTASTSRAELTAFRRDLIDAIKPDRTAQIEPLILRYRGGNQPVDIYCHYDTGLQGEYRILEYEELNLRFTCYDPFWYGLGKQATVLDTRDTLAVDLFAARIDGVWENLGGPAVTPQFVGGAVRDFAWSNDRRTLYITGSFINFDGIANADGIAMYNFDTATWSALGTGLNSAGNSVHVDKDDNVFVVGAFTTAGGNTAYGAAMWDGATWTGLATTSNWLGSGELTSLLDYEGNLYVGGNISEWNGNAAHHTVVKWTASSATWSTIIPGSYVGEAPTDIVQGPDGKIYIADISSANSVTYYDRILVYDPVAATVSGLATSGTTSGPFNAIVYALAFGPDGRLYAGGSFTQIAGVSADHAARYTGGGWESLGDGLEDSSIGAEIRKMSFDENGILYAVGYSDGPVGLSDLNERYFRWNGFSWAPLDIKLPSTPYVYQVKLSPTGDLYLGFDSEGTAEIPGLVTVDNEGTASAWPTLIFTRSGGTSATIRSIKNNTTGSELMLFLPMLDGETVTIELRPEKVSITSDRRGNLNRYLLRGSDATGFTLLPGENEIATLVTEVGSPTVTGFIQWTETFWSVDGVH